MSKKSAIVDWLDQTGSGVDLRTKHARALADRLVLRAEWLVPSDRQLVLAVFRDGQTVADVARLLGHSPRPLRRRLNRVVRRLLDPRSMFVIREGPRWSTTKRRVGHETILHGNSLRDCADKLGVSLHAVRTHRQWIEDRFDAWQASPEATSGIDRTWR